METETQGELLQRMGASGAVWAAEFNKVAVTLGYSDMDEGWLIGWFANAIEAGRNANAKPPRTNVHLCTGR